MQSPRTTPTSHRSPCAPVSAQHHHLPIRVRVVAAAVVASVGMGAVLAGPALADPEQPGVTDTAPTAPEQPGVTNPQPAPEPAPAEPAIAPAYPQGALPSPPSTGADPVIWTEPSGPSAETPYTPLPEGPLHEPRPTPPVAPKYVPVDQIRLGNQVWDRGVVPEPWAVTINEYTGWTEAEIARHFESIGFTRDEAARRAAAAVFAGVTGGAIVAVAVGGTVFLTTALLAVPAGAIIGGIIGTTVPIPPPPLNTLAGAGLGAAAGLGVAAAAGAASGAAAFTIAAAGFGIAGWLLGAGDATSNPTAPWETPPPPAPAPAPLPNPGANQYELVLDAPTASDAGLPAVDYTVNTDGDVSFSANIAGIPPVEAGWTAEQAAQPYEVLGQWAEPTKQAVASVTKQVSDGLTSVVDGLHIAYPQTVPAP